MIASGLLALMAAATSCDKYDIYPEQYGEVLMIKDAGEKSVTIYATDDAASYYVSVMKGGHTPENPATAILRVMNDNDFAEYKELFYGDANFVGLQSLNPDFYSIEDATSGEEIEAREITHEFTSADDRYFGVNVILNAQKISDWREGLETRAAYSQADLEKDGSYTEQEIADLMAEKELATDTLNNYTFVVPIGLYSPTDSVNADNYYLMLEPSVENPELSVNIDHCGYLISEISRNELISIQSAGDASAMFEPEVTLSIPCKNNYGFKVRLSQAISFVNDFNSAHSDMQLTTVKNTKGEYDYFTLGTWNETDQSYDSYVEFPAGVTEVRLPLSYVYSNINVDDVANSYAVGVQLQPSKEYYTIDEQGNAVKQEKASKNTFSPDMVWPEGTPVKVMKSLSLPEVPDGVTPSYTNYTIYVGYKVVETPLDLDASCVTSNDCEPTEGSIEALFDNDLSTFFHSGWTVAFERSAPFGSYLEIEVPSSTAINACYFQFTSRVIANPASPKEVHLYYSNEDDAQYREDEAAWTYFAKVVLAKKLGSGETGELGSLDNMAQAPETFKYLRFCVIKSTFGTSEFDLTVSSTTAYWNLAELRMYGKYVE